MDLETMKDTLKEIVEFVETLPEPYRDRSFGFFIEAIKSGVVKGIGLIAEGI